MTKRLTCGNDGVYPMLKETLHALADRNELRRRREVREVLTKLDAFDDRLAEVEAVQRGLLEHVLATKSDDCKTGLRGTKEDLPPAAAATGEDDAVEITGFVPQRRSRLTMVNKEFK